MSRKKCPLFLAHKWNDGRCRLSGWVPCWLSLQIFQNQALNNPWIILLSLYCSQIMNNIFIHELLNLKRTAAIDACMVIVNSLVSFLQKNRQAIMLHFAAPCLWLPAIFILRHTCFHLSILCSDKTFLWISSTLTSFLWSLWWHSRALFFLCWFRCLSTSPKR